MQRLTFANGRPPSLCRPLCTLPDFKLMTKSLPYERWSRIRRCVTWYYSWFHQFLRAVWLISIIVVAVVLYQTLTSLHKSILTCLHLGGDWWMFECSMFIMWFFHAKHHICASRVLLNAYLMDLHKLCWSWRLECFPKKLIIDHCTVPMPLVALDFNLLNSTQCQSEVLTANSDDSSPDDEA